MSASTTPVKKSKLNTYEKHDFEIGDRAIHVQVSNFSGATRCDLRHFFYHEDQQLFFPTNRGASLRWDEFRDLKGCIEDLYDFMETSVRKRKYGVPTEDGDENGDREERNVWIGERGFRANVCFYNDNYAFHVRYYEHDDKRDCYYPTRKGVLMNVAELYELVKLMPRLDELMRMLESRKCKRKLTYGESKDTNKRQRAAENNSFRNFQPEFYSMRDINSSASLAE